MQITIDEQFKSLLPALDKETYRLLEENLLTHGCLNPLILWDGILIDGHNRYEICTNHGIPFETTEKEFATREEVLIWIIANQVSRRNLMPMQLSYFRGLHYRADKRITSNPGGKNQHGEVGGKNCPQPPTANRLSDKYRVSPRTIKNDARLANAIDAIGEISPEAKKKILSEEVAINKNKLVDMASWQEEEIEAVAAQIKNGTYKRRAPTAQSPATGEGNQQNADAKSPAEPGSAPPPAGQRPTDAITGIILNEYYAMLRKLNTNDSTAELKTALRDYIDTLEGLYSNIT